MLWANQQDWYRTVVLDVLRLSFGRVRGHAVDLHSHQGIDDGQRLFAYFG